MSARVLRFVKRDRARETAITFAVVGWFVLSARAIGIPASAEAKTVAGVPGVVARTLPAVVSITTRQIEHDQFNRTSPRAGRALA